MAAIYATRLLVVLLLAFVVQREGMFSQFKHKRQKRYASGKNWKIYAKVLNILFYTVTYTKFLFQIIPYDLLCQPLKVACMLLEYINSLDVSLHREGQCQSMTSRAFFMIIQCGDITGIATTEIANKERINGQRQKLHHIQRNKIYKIIYIDHGLLTLANDKTVSQNDLSKINVNIIHFVDMPI